ncbi:unnamed protein product [Amoebophrya sp. A120]|nr:unnamed protein product [Amoebophrya sp. A120]|eukprot:GSA120T00006515001.1
MSGNIQAGDWVVLKDNFRECGFEPPDYDLGDPLPGQLGMALAVFDHAEEQTSEASRPLQSDLFRNPSSRSADHAHAATRMILVRVRLLHRDPGFFVQQRSFSPPIVADFADTSTSSCGDEANSGEQQKKKITDTTLPDCVLPESILQRVEVQKLLVNLPAFRGYLEIKDNTCGGAMLAGCYNALQHLDASWDPEQCELSAVGSDGSYCPANFNVLGRLQGWRTDAGGSVGGSVSSQIMGTRRDTSTAQRQEFKNESSGRFGSSSSRLSSARLEVEVPVGEEEDHAIMGTPEEGPRLSTVSGGNFVPASRTGSPTAKNAALVSVDLNTAIELQPTIKLTNDTTSTTSKKSQGSSLQAETATPAGSREKETQNKVRVPKNVQFGLRKLHKVALESLEETKQRLERSEAAANGTLVQRKKRLEKAVEELVDAYNPCTWNIGNLEVERVLKTTSAQAFCGATRVIASRNVGKDKFDDSPDGARLLWQTLFDLASERGGGWDICCNATHRAGATAPAGNKCGSAEDGAPAKGRAKEQKEVPHRRGPAQPQLQKNKRSAQFLFHLHGVLSGSYFGHFALIFAIVEYKLAAEKVDGDVVEEHASCSSSSRSTGGDKTQEKTNGSRIDELRTKDKTSTSTSSRAQQKGEVYRQILTARSYQGPRHWISAELMQKWIYRLKFTGYEIRLVH